MTFEPALGAEALTSGRWEFTLRCDACSWEDKVSVTISYESETHEANPG
jgi:hypothetical protein